MKHILVTGGAGYIGLHTVVELVAAGFQPVIADNFCNSSPEALDRLKQIVNQDIPFEEVDLCDKAALAAVFDKYEFDAAIHFAGLKAVGESVAKPLLYYHNNIVSTLNLCELMVEHGVNQLVFSSSATVYGIQEQDQYTEDMSINPFNPYGRTKAMVEQILQDLVVAQPGMQITLLRYFNPIGAHESGLIGEDPNGIPNNLLPFVAQVAVGKRDKLQIFGNDYRTPDGTGVRDYIHVVDLAKGHVAALQHMPPTGTCEAFNLGSGRGYSVLEVVAAFGQAAGKDIPYEFAPRRPGDIDIYYADPSKAQTMLEWKTEKSLDQACADTWKWQQYISKQSNG